MASSSELRRIEQRYDPNLESACSRSTCAPRTFTGSTPAARASSSGK